MKCQSNIPKYEEFKFLNECQIQFDSILESLKSARKLYVDSGLWDKHEFEMVVNDDPTPTKKYVERMCKWSMEAGDEEDIYPDMVNCISIYDNLCNKNLIKEKDINSFKTFEAFQKFVNKNKNLISKAQQKDQVKTKEADVILDDDKFFIISPLTHGASCIFGAGTKWCTTMKDPRYWKQYTAKFVKFYYCLDKSADTTDDMYKFAVAVYPSGEMECYDAKDNNFNFIEVLRLGLKKELFKPENITLEKSIKSWFDSDYTIDEEGFYSTNGNVTVKNWKGEQLPIKFKFTGKVFDCSDLGLKTLEGCPEECTSFYCDNNKLTSLEYCPKIVHAKFCCNNNQLKTLEYMPKCSDINCSENNLISLKGSPKTTENFQCFKNNLKTLEHGPETANSYHASANALESTKGFPKKVNEYFYLNSNYLESINDIPTHMPDNSYIYLKDNEKTLKQSDLPKHCKATVIN